MRVPASAEDRPSRLRIEYIGESDDIRSLWTTLAAASRNIFSTWEWFDVWWRHFGEGRELRLALCTDESGRPLAILPLYVVRRHPRVLRFAGHTVSGMLAPICAPGDRASVLAAIGANSTALGCDVLLADSFADAAALNGTTLLRVPSPVIRLSFADWDDYLASCSSNFRQQLRRKERKLAREHQLQYRGGNAENATNEMQLLFELHGQRWDEGESLFATPERRAFHLDFASVAAERGWLRMWFVVVDGEPVAAWHGFRFSGIETYYQLGRHRDWGHASVGMLAVAHSLREAITDGMDEYHLGPGGSSYKYRFTDDESTVEVLALPGSSMGRAAIAVGDLLWRSRLKALPRKLLSLERH